MIGNQQSLVRSNSGLLSVLSSGQLNLNVFQKDILVLECIVAGTSFRKLDGIDELLSTGTKLDLVREAGNPFDSFAVAVEYQDVKLGYIPKEKNEVVARLMDSGKSFFANVAEKEWEGNWLRLEVQVFLVD